MRRWSPKTPRTLTLMSLLVASPAVAEEGGTRPALPEVTWEVLRNVSGEPFVCLDLQEGDLLDQWLAREPDRQAYVEGLEESRDVWQDLTYQALSQPKVQEGVPVWMFVGGVLVAVVGGVVLGTSLR